MPRGVIAPDSSASTSKRTKTSKPSPPAMAKR
jgi:hypothetical protein